MNNNALHLDLNKVRQHKRDIFNKVQSNEWTKKYILTLDENTADSNINEAIKDAKRWCNTELENEALEIFGISSWSQLNQKPEDFKLIKRVEFSEDPNEYPKVLCQPAGDEITVVFLDFETTGLSHQKDKVIELGLVKLKYSPSLKCITEINLVRSEYNDPGVAIPLEITEITGICDADVKNRKIDIEQVKHWLESEDTYIIAHNSKFDRPFFEQLMGQDNYRWGCSASEVDWKSFKQYRIESAKLEYILLKLGFFYEGHRASIDCLAMVQMFFVLPQALEQLIDKIGQNTITIEATKAPFDIKDKLKSAGYRWNPDKKTWWKTVSESELDQGLDELDHFSSSYSSKKATQIKLSARERFKL